MSDKTLSKIYYSPKGFWKELEAAKKLLRKLEFLRMPQDSLVDEAGHLAGKSLREVL